MRIQDKTSFPKEVQPSGKNIAISATAMFIAKAIRITFLSLMNIILINLLNPQDFGSVRYVLIIVGIANIINEMGISSAIIQREEFPENLLFPLFLITSFLGVFLYFVTFIFAPFISNFFNSPELTKIFRIGTLIIPSMSISSVHRAWLRRNMKFVKLAIIEMISTLLSSIISIIWAFLGGGVWALLGSYLLFEAISTIIILFIQKFSYFTLNIKSTIPILLWGSGMVIFYIVDYMLSNATHFLIGKFADKKALGLFSVSQDLAFLPRVGINAVLGTIIFSTFSRIQKDNEKTVLIFQKFVLFISIVSIPFQLMTICMPQEFLRIICFVKKNSVWLNAAPLLRWLSATAIIYNYTYFLNTIWLSNGRLKSSTLVSLIMLITICISIIIGFNWGLIGICKAIFIRALIFFPVYMYLNYIFVNIKIKYYLKSLLPSFVGGLIMGIYLLLIQYLFKTSTFSAIFIKFILSFMSGSFIYLLTLKFIFPDALKEIIDGFKIPLKNIYKRLIL